MTTRAPENLTQIDPHRRRRIVAPAQATQEPMAEEEDDASLDEIARQIPDAPFYAHAVRTPANRRRWNFPACVMETIKPSTVARWDAAEDALAERVVGRRVVVTKYDRARSWERIGSWDDRDGVESRGNPKMLTEDLLRAEHGAGSYTFLVYFITEDENGEPEQHNTRTFKQTIGGAAASVAAPARPATPPAPAAPPVAPQASPFAMPFGAANPFAAPFAVPGAPAGMPPMPAPTNAQEWFAMMNLSQQMAASQAAAAKAAADAEDARATRDRQKKLDDLEYRKQLDAFERDRSERARKERDDDQARKDREDDRRAKRAHEAQIELLEIQRLRAAGSAMDPVEAALQQKAAMERFQKIFGGNKEDSESIWEKLAGQVISSPNAGKAIDLIREIMSGSTRLAHVETAVFGRADSPLQEEEPLRPNPAPPTPQPTDQPPPSSVPPVAPTQPAPERAPDDLEEGDTCPDCGNPIPCKHYDARAEGETEECDLCPECDHGDEFSDANGDCTRCGPCTHVEERLVETSTGRVVGVRQVPPEPPAP
jgi:hypothetical protein